ncbi:hypothetical protein LTR84_007085 [Exophiala bonariae]|uniref:Major facilitator superfamily (MFS) profile domain-containing protein n=1 Tax=Exophiala bonariae TaxID=1690606 RepID=A0AAV9N1R9_9EURO|nr:hypothetical protein LTR84_007085 [Exophiala bonariae]
MVELPTEQDRNNRIVQNEISRFPAEHDHDTLTKEEMAKNILGESSEHELEHYYPTGLAKAMIIGPVTMTYFLFFLDLAIVSTATPAITSHFDSLVDIGWYGGAYQLGSSALQPLTGKLFSYFSTKWMFIFFLVVFMFGSALCGAAQSSSMLIIGRAVAGAGSAGLRLGGVTILAAILPPIAQARFMGLNLGLGQLGLALGPILGGIFTQYLSWRWCFYINLPIGAVVGGLLLYCKIPEPKPKPPVREVLRTAVKSLDLAGFFLVSPSAVMLLLGLQYGGNQFAWNSSTVIGLLVGAAVAFIIFLLWERRKGDEAMIPFAMLRHRIIWSATGTMFFLLATILVGDFYLAIYFQTVHNDSPVMSGVHMLPATISMVMFTMTAGVLVGVVGYYLPWVLAGSSLTAIGYGLLSLVAPATPAAKWIGYQVIWGVGSGLMVAGPYIAVQNLVPAAQIPIAMGIITFAQNMGSAIFLVVANAVFSNSLRKELQERIAVIKLTPEVIIDAGAHNIRELVSGTELSAVLQAYSDSVDKVMYLGVAVSIVTFAFAWGLGWNDIRVQKKLLALQEGEVRIRESDPSK